MRLLIIFILILINTTVIGQIISTSIPKEVSKSQKYLFYLHGQVVTELGNNAINQGAPEWGPYEYLNILDSLRNRGFNVISEIRHKGIDDSVYVNKVSKQIDSLLQQGVSARNIVVLGASSGWDIVVHVSSKLKYMGVNFVMMGGCWPDDYKYYLNMELYGHFLSIIEKTDPHGTCCKIFEGRKHLDYKEVLLNTGLSHGFFYKGRKEWIDPIVNWLQEQKPK